MSLDDALKGAAQAAAGVSGVQVRTTSAGDISSSEDLGKFDQGASTQLLLFIFITSLTGSLALIETRRLGVARRMFSTPTAARTILAGEALGRFGVALAHGLIIMLGSALIFGVNWGDPAGAALILIMFSLVGAGASMLLGSTFHSDQQAQSVARCCWAWGRRPSVAAWPRWRSFRTRCGRSPTSLPMLEGKMPSTI